VKSYVPTSYTLYHNDRKSRGGGILIAVDSSVSSTLSHSPADLPTSHQRSMELAQKKGASTLLTALPIEEHGFTLHKAAFFLSDIVGHSRTHHSTAVVDNHLRTVEHALICKIAT